MVETGLRACARHPPGLRRRLQRARERRVLGRVVGAPPQPPVALLRVQPEPLQQRLHREACVPTRRRPRVAQRGHHTPQADEHAGQVVRRQHAGALAVLQHVLHRGEDVQQPGGRQGDRRRLTRRTAVAELVPQYVEVAAHQGKLRPGGQRVRLQQPPHRRQHHRGLPVQRRLREAQQGRCAAQLAERTHCLRGLLRRVQEAHAGVPVEPVEPAQVRRRHLEGRDALQQVHVLLHFVQLRVARHVRRQRPQHVTHAVRRQPARRGGRGSVAAAAAPLHTLPHRLQHGEERIRLVLDRARCEDQLAVDDGLRPVAALRAGGEHRTLRLRRGGGALEDGMRETLELRVHDAVACERAEHVAQRRGGVRRRRRLRSRRLRRRVSSGRRRGGRKVGGHFVGKAEKLCRTHLAEGACRCPPHLPYGGGALSLYGCMREDGGAAVFNEVQIL
eukprot:Rhum_TRINITY_DN11814_c0_g1::Rhum_TRINITY_DN11814_c0_g1_i1::g.47228::m.47228